MRCRLKIASLSLNFLSSPGVGGFLYRLIDVKLMQGVPEVRRCKMEA